MSFHFALQIQPNSFALLISSFPKFLLILSGILGFHSGHLAGCWSLYVDGYPNNRQIWVFDSIL